MEKPAKIRTAPATKKAHAPKEPAVAPAAGRVTDRHDQSPDERFEAGKALRASLSRAAHAPWKRPSDRADPIALLQQSDADRLPELVPWNWPRTAQRIAA